MAMSYGKKGQEDRAIELYERTLRITVSVLGPHAPFMQEMQRTVATSSQCAALARAGGGGDSSYCAILNYRYVYAAGSFMMKSVKPSLHDVTWLPLCKMQIVMITSCSS